MTRLVPWEGTQRERELTQTAPTWKMSKQSHRWAAQFWGPACRRQALLAGWRTARKNLQTEEWVPLVRSVWCWHLTRQIGKDVCLVAVSFPGLACYVLQAETSKCPNPYSMLQQDTGLWCLGPG